MSAVGPDVSAVGPDASAVEPDALQCLTEHGGHCITCSDEGVPMRVLTVDDDLALATCEDGAGAPCTIDVGLIDGVTPGQTLLTHAGTAIAVLERDPGAGA